MLENFRADYSNNTKFGMLLMGIFTIPIGLFYTKSLLIEKIVYISNRRNSKAIKINKIKLTNWTHLYAVLYTLTFGPIILIIGLISIFMFIVNVF